MKIVQLSTGDIGGGAARAAYRLHNGLLRLGIDSTMLVLRRTSGQPSVRGLKWSEDLATRLRRRHRRNQIRRDFDPYRKTLPPGFELFSDDRSEVGFDLVRQIPPCDLINLHWVAGFLDYEIFFDHLPPRMPLVWRLPDMSPLTGGCHYDGGCGKFPDRCGACPVLGSTHENDLSRQVWKRKSAALEKLDVQQLHVVGPSRWIAQQAKRSSLLGRFPSSVIPNGVDVTEFAPRDKGSSRDVLGVPRQAKVVLFAADSASNPRKGFQYLAAALAGIGGTSEVFLLTVGGGKPEAPDFPQLHLGKIADDRMLAMIYSAADVFVIPSLQESFGLTVIESMACGTPVVGFDTGGIPDMVRPGESGFLAPLGDARALGHAILQALDAKTDRVQMGERCRQIAVEEYSQELQARRYAELYRSILAELPAQRVAVT